MSEYLIQEETLTGIANAIRAKGHSYADRNDDIVVSDMAGRIRKLDNLNYAVYVDVSYNINAFKVLYDNVRDNIIYVKPILDGTIFDVEHLNLYINSTSGVVTAASSNTVYTKYIKCISNTNYTFILNDAQTVLIAGFDKLPVTGVTGTIIYGAGKTNAEATLEYTVNSGNYEYLGIWYYDSSTNDTIPNITIKYDDLDGVMLSASTYDYVISHNRPSNVKDGLIWIKNGNCNSEMAFNAVNDSMQYIQGKYIDSNCDDGAIMINPVSVKICKLLNGEYVWVNPAEARLICPGFNYDIKNTESMKDEIAELIEGELVDIENDDVTKVRDYGFFRYYNLNSVSFPNCYSVGGSAFAYCSSLTTAWLPKCASFGTSAFYSCTKIQNAALGLVSFVSGHPMKNASKALVNVSLPYCTSISNSAFTGHTLLEKVYAPMATTVNANAFQSCTSLKEVTLGLTELTSTNHRLSQASSTLISVCFPQCTNVGAAAFPIKDGSLYYACYSNMQYLDFPECVSIGDNAFTSIYGGPLTANFPKCTTIGSSAFCYVPNLEKVNFPECVSIGSCAFFCCSDLSSAIFPKCTTVNRLAFYKCHLTSVSFPKCTTIGNGAFYRCSHLESAVFPECIIVYDSGFRRCTILSQITLPKCSILYSYVFSECTSLQTLRLDYSSVVTMSGDVFYNTPMSLSTLTGKFGSIYVPASLVSAYKTATNWSVYSARITAIT